MHVDEVQKPGYREKNKEVYQPYSSQHILSWSSYLQQPLQIKANKPDIILKEGKEVNDIEWNVPFKVREKLAK